MRLSGRIVKLFVRHYTSLANSCTIGRPACTQRPRRTVAVYPASAIFDVPARGRRRVATLELHGLDLPCGVRGDLSPIAGAKGISRPQYGQGFRRSCLAFRSRVLYNRQP